MIGTMPDSTIPASIIVPTYREVANIRPLTERVFAALRCSHREGELILVDDNSGDGTEQAVDALKSEYAVRLIVRTSERGLSSAVLEGFQAAKHDLLVVMDADLQHPPETIPAMLERLESNDCDFVVGTRYAAGASLAREWSWHRRIISRMGTLLAAPLAPLSDPMSGFFALRRATWKQAERLNPVGYKIGLELYVKSRCRRPAEVPIVFAERAAGESKYGVREMVRFIRHLLRLYRFRFPAGAWCILIALTLAIVLTAVLTWRGDFS